jgi:ribose transport system permease protein
MVEHPIVRAGGRQLRRLAGVRLGHLRAAPGAPIWAVFAVLFAVAWIVVDLHGEDFVTVQNVRNMLVRSVALGIVAVGQTLVILGGSLDISVAYLISVTAVMASDTMNGDPNRIPQAIGLVLAIGVAVGLVNGLLITRAKVNAFMATLGTGLILRGLLEAHFDNYAGSVPSSFQHLGYSNLGPIPYSILLFAAVAVLAWYLLRHTRFGYHLYAVGGNEEASRLSGVRSGRVLIGAHILCSLAAVLTGLFLVSRVGAGAPWVGPQGRYDLESIAAVVVGGTALMGGRGGVSGTVAGVFILAVLDNVFNQVGVNSFLKDVVRGVILVGAVAAYSYRRRRAVTA